jgi:hypothetical protein
MLPHTFVLMCTFQVGVVELLVEVLFFLVLEPYFLTYTESDGVGFSFFVLLRASFAFEANVFGS